MHGSIHLFERLPQVGEAPIGQPHDAAATPVRNKPLVGLIRNQRSHRNASRAQSVGKTPAELNAEHSDERADVLVAFPGKRSELPAILADFATQKVDYIAIDGGDGTVRDVLTCGAGTFGDAWPELIVLPSGKTNALAHDLGIPEKWTLDKALDVAKHGRIVRRQPLVVSQRDDLRSQVRGFVMGGGAFTRAISLGQKSHSLGAFNAAVVGLTAAWSAVQAMFGSAGNPWRQGTRMRITDATGGELKFCGGLPEGERYVLFSSTLERFPTGLNPFRGVAQPLKIAVLDNPSRGLLLRIAAIFNGTASAATRARGYHAFGAEAVDLDIGDCFILDGEAFPPGQYRLSAGSKLRFVVP